MVIVLPLKKLSGAWAAAGCAMASERRRAELEGVMFKSYFQLF